ncbi:MAG: cysteine--tRNA ligase [Atopobiaceae bacterium]|jgi:cysteinyl-tRNA synthetase|nr:cysteine--tRNA ligase [Atopobiaceae bacterium]
MLVYNTQMHKKQELEPIEPGRIRMYVCGPTVYDQIHIGNGRTFLSFDVIRRYLSYKGYEVTFAQNLTDVDDKIINRANEQGRTAEEVATEFSEAFIAQMRRLNVLDPDIRPRATHEIGPMIEMVSSLIEQGNAYAVASGDVYFSVRSCPTYGTVSGRNVDDLMVGARIEENSDKHDPLDFALWKAAKPGEPSWDSPWGAGRPGWHTECCTMIHRYLGTPIDIHGGGSDLVFPHHENESAQATCCWHEKLANVWMHTGMLRVDGEKMSKSLGNFYTLKEVLDKYPADAVRLLMLQTHYRSPLDFSFSRLDGTLGTLERIRGTVANLRWAAESSSSADHTVCDADHVLGDAVRACREEFVRQMDDDFNTAGALAAVFGLVTTANTYLDESGADLCCSAVLRASDTIAELLGVLGIDSVRVAETTLPHELVDLACAQAGFTGDDADDAATALLAARAQARAEKDWPRADAIRDGIQALGLVVEDTAAGARLKPAAGK